MPVKAIEVVSAGGGVFTTEAHSSKCWVGEEVSSCEIDVPVGALCDLCGETIEDEPEEVCHERR